MKDGYADSMAQKERIFTYFPFLSPLQKRKYDALYNLYVEWNNRVNLISRKDMDALYRHHVLHSMGVGKALSFVEGTTVLDVGTGGGFPGIPLAILYPKVHFTLVDSIKKKMRAVESIVGALGLDNVRFLHGRVEKKKKKRHEFILSRAVASMEKIIQWTEKNLSKDKKNNRPNGWIFLKGGDLGEEMKNLPFSGKIYNMADFFSEPFFDTKKIVHIYP